MDNKDRLFHNLVALTKRHTHELDQIHGEIARELDSIVKTSDNLAILQEENRKLKSVFQTLDDSYFNQNLGGVPCICITKIEWNDAYNTILGLEP